MSTMSTIVVRYRPRDGDADTNEQLIHDVFADLAEAAPDGISYTVWRLADGTFLHIAELAGDDNPLPRSSAFQQFVTGIDGRCGPDDQPVAHSATRIGTYPATTNTT
jgi:hypothetical protein